MAWDPLWESVFLSQAWGRYPSEELIRFVARNYYSVPNRSAIRFLEIGCGPGANLWFLAREGFSFVGIDAAPTAINQAEERLDADVPGWRKNGELRVGDIGKLPFPSETFDVVIDNEAVCCNNFMDALSIYREARRVMIKGGCIYIRTFSEGSWGDGTGEQLGNNTWICSEGPLHGKGLARFTPIDEIPILLEGFENLRIEKVICTMEERQHSVEEWIITAERTA